MRRVGITQQQVLISDRKECRNSIDQSWILFFEKLGLDVVQIPNGMNDISGWVYRQSIHGFVLSGGNDIDLATISNPDSYSRDFTEKTILQMAEALTLPVLGVCRGMQMMNIYLGGRVSSIEGHAGGFHRVKTCATGVDFKDYKIVNSFHNWGIIESDLAPSLVPLVYADDSTIEAFSHTVLPWHGIMWHPERDNQDNSDRDSKLVSTIFYDD